MTLPPLDALRHRATIRRMAGSRRGRQRYTHTETESCERSHSSALQALGTAPIRRRGGGQRVDDGGVPAFRRGVFDLHDEVNRSKTESLIGTRRRRVRQAARADRPGDRFVTDAKCQRDSAVAHAEFAKVPAFEPPSAPGGKGGASRLETPRSKGRPISSDCRQDLRASTRWSRMPESGDKRPGAMMTVVLGLITLRVELAAHFLDGTSGRVGFVLLVRSDSGAVGTDLAAASPSGRCHRRVPGALFGADSDRGRSGRSRGGWE
jgi:hypothetical protein